MCLSGMIGWEDGGGEPSVHLSLLSLMEELLPPPGHSLSVRLYVRKKGASLEEKGKEARRRRDTLVARKGDGKERSRNGTVKGRKREREREGGGSGDGNSMYGVDTRLLRKFESEDVDLAGSSYLAHILKLRTSTIYGSVRAGNGGV